MENNNHSLADAKGIIELEAAYEKAAECSPSQAVESAATEESVSAPTDQLVQCNRYVKKERIAALAEVKGTLGITTADLIRYGLANSKEQAQDRLQRSLEKGVLFTIGKHCPQVYYASSKKSDILKAKSEQSSVTDHTGVTKFEADKMTIQTLEGYVLPLLPKTGLHIHKLNFKTSVDPEEYGLLKQKPTAGNNGKQVTCRLDRNHKVDFTVYPNGTVNIYTESSKAPFRLVNEEDHSILMAFIGQIRCLLGLNLKHAHIPEITEWTITQCDINKDVRMADTFHQNAINVQVKHMDRIFRVYIKSMGADTVCRVEESLSPKKPAIKVIADLMNPTGRLEDKFTALQSQVAALQLQTPSMGANN